MFMYVYFFPETFDDFFENSSTTRSVLLNFEKSSKNLAISLIHWHKSTEYTGIAGGEKIISYYSFREIRI